MVEPDNDLLIKLTYDNRFENGFNYFERMELEEYEYNNANITTDEDVNIMSMNNTGFNAEKYNNQSPSTLTKGNV